MNFLTPLVKLWKTHQDTVCFTCRLKSELGYIVTATITAKPVYDEAMTIVQRQLTVKHAREASNLTYVTTTQVAEDAFQKLYFDYA